MKTNAGRSLGLEEAHPTDAPIDWWWLSIINFIKGPFQPAGVLKPGHINGLYRISQAYVIFHLTPQSQTTLIQNGRVHSARIWAKGNGSNPPVSDRTETYFSIVSSPPDYICLTHHLLPVERSARNDDKQLKKEEGKKLANAIWNNNSKSQTHYQHNSAQNKSDISFFSGEHIPGIQTPKSLKMASLTVSDFAKALFKQISPLSSSS